MAAIPRLAYLDEGLLDCRLRGIHTALNRRDHLKARDLIAECVRLFRSGDWYMEKDVHTAAIDEMFHILGDLAMKRYMKAHDRVRDLHYFIRRKVLDADEEANSERDFFESMMADLLADE